MKPSEMSLFTTAEQALLVETESARLDRLNEDELMALLSRVRRARNKYSDLHRRQGASAVRASGKRYAAKTSNERTLRKAEIFDDAVSRVARYVSRAARANANDVKEARLAMAAKPAKQAAAKGGGKPSARKSRPAGTKQASKSTGTIEPARKGATSAAGRRSQSKRDTRTKK